MRLGPVLKLQTELAKLIQSCPKCLHCKHCHEQAPVGDKEEGNEVKAEEDTEDKNETGPEDDNGAQEENNLTKEIAQAKVEDLTQEED